MMLGVSQFFGLAYNQSNCLIIIPSVAVIAG